MRAIRRLVGLLVLASALSGCAARFLEPQNVADAQGQTDSFASAAPDVPGDTAIVVAFSGGGTRAAAFAHGVMLGLDGMPAGNRRSRFDEIVAYSGVSGGSVAAAYYGLTGRQALSDFRERFLLKNAEEDLETGINIVNLGVGLDGGVNDASRLSRWLDRNLFEGAPLSAVFRHGKPTVWLNASDLHNGTPFVFNPASFSAICSDPSKFPLSLAVSASAAMPVAFVPIVLESHPGACGGRGLPAWVRKTLADPDAGGQAKAVARAFKRYRDPGHMRYLKLVDGGLTDNFGLSGLVVARASADTPYAPLTARSVVKLRRLLFIVVNSARESDVAWTQTVEGPSGTKLLQAISDAAIDSSVRSGFDSFRLTVREWEAAARKWRCGMNRAEAGKLGVSSGWKCDDLDFEIAEIAFDQLDPAWSAELYNVPTRFRLQPEQVDSVVRAGVQAVRRNAIVRRALSQSDSH